MRRLVYFVAVTLDGFIAGPDGGDPSGSDFLPVTPDLVEHLVSTWPETLPGPAREAMGLSGAGTHFDTVVEGRGSYDVGLAAGLLDAYPHLRHLVVSTSLADRDDLPVEVVTGDPVERVRQLKAEDGLDIWLVVGGTLAQALRVLGDKVVEDKKPAEKAATMWLELPPEERAVTAIFASGKESRETINKTVQEGLIKDGTLKGDGLFLTVHQPVSMLREQLRYQQSYKPGQTLHVRGSVPEIGLSHGAAEVQKVLANGKVVVKLESTGRNVKFSPQRIDPMIDSDRMQLTTLETVRVFEGDRIRWTATDKERGMHNAAMATITSIEGGRVTVELASKETVTLAANDPMLSRLDLAYALNAHMAQGVTADKAIGVMQSFESNLSNQLLTNVIVTRVRDDLIMVVDDQKRLEAQLDRNTGYKTSSLESLGRLEIDGAGRNTKDADDALSKAMAVLDEIKEPILIDPASLDMTDLPPVGASQNDYADMKGMEDGMPPIGTSDDAAHRDAGRPDKDDQLGLPPLDMDDLSSLPAMSDAVEQLRGIPEKNLSLDM